MRFAFRTALVLYAAVVSRNLLTMYGSTQFSMSPCRFANLVFMLHMVRSVVVPSESSLQKTYGAMSVKVGFPGTLFVGSKFNKPKIHNYVQYLYNNNTKAKYFSMYIAH